MKIGDYQVEKSLTTNQDISFFVVRDSGQKTFMLRKLKGQASEITNDAWFQCYEDYQLNITNFKYLPKPLVISTYENEAYTTFSYESGALLREVQQLSLAQVEQLIEAVRHLHKKGFIHGSINENTIWLRENGDLQLFGAGEKKVLSPSERLHKQLDYDLIFAIIKRFTPIKVKGSKTPTSLEELQDLLQTGQTKPGLVEKETQSNIDHRAAVPDIVSDSSDKKRKTGEKTPKNKSKKWWMIGIGVSLLLVAVVFVSNISKNSTVQTTKVENKVITEEKKSTTVEKGESKPPELDLQQFALLFPNWQFIKQETIKINSSYYTILGIGLKGTDGEMGKAKVAVLHYNAESKEWSKKWETQEFECEPSNDVEYYMDMSVLNPQDQNKALLVFGIQQYRAGYEVNAVEIDGKGNGEIVWEGAGYALVKKDDSIILQQLGETLLTLSNNQLNVKTTNRSEVGPANAVKAHFVINENGLVVPTKERNMNVKVGDVLTFIPDNDETKRHFDEGDISLYTNMGNSGPVGTSNAEMITGGNAVEFTEEGTFEFLLDYYDEQSGSYLDNPPATFVVHVGDGSTNSQQNTSDSITIPFKIGAGLRELINHYGQPEYDNGFSGARLVVFGKDGYILDEAEIVIGYYFANPEISIYNAHVGMTPSEINSILGSPDESYLNEESQVYDTVYRKDGYEIRFESSEENGATDAVIIVET